MTITLADFSFKIEELLDVAEVDKLIEENDLRLQGLRVKLDSRSYRLNKRENRSEDLDEDIAELENKITGRESDLANETPGSVKHEEIEIELDGLRADLRKLKFRRRQKTPPSQVVESTIDAGEAQLLLDYYTELQTALEARKTELG